uniref:FGFR1 oncogene partner 2 n=1 Tax=Xiphophorus couchianus TaxID=32473 RepID=A0A3B5MA81_9TELE
SDCCTEKKEHFTGSNSTRIFFLNCLAYQEEIDSLNQVARHRPRSSLVLGIQQENRQIRELQQENKELRTSLEEHQSALELIMTKYREQVFRLLMTSKREDPAIVTQLKEQHTTEMQAHIDKINEMASVMRKAIEVDEGRVCEDEERIKQLENILTLDLENISRIKKANKTTIIQSLDIQNCNKNNNHLRENRPKWQGVEANSSYHVSKALQCFTKLSTILRSF